MGSIRRRLRQLFRRDSNSSPTATPAPKIKRLSWRPRQFRKGKTVAKPPANTTHDVYDRAEESDSAKDPNAAVKGTELQLLELPLDIRSNPFSKATFSASSKRPSEPVETQVEHATAFKFLDLPTELRLQVLTHYFGRRTVAARLDGATVDEKAKRYCMHAPNFDIYATAVLRTCKQLHEEGEDVLWDCTSFIVKVKTMHITPSWLDAPGLGRGLSLSRMRHAILNIEMETASVDSTEDEVVWQCDTETPAIDLLLKQVAAGKGLRTADVHLDFGHFSGDSASSVFSKLSDLKVERLKSISCVRLKPLSDDGQATCVPFESEEFQAVIRKFKALDVSEQQCGHLMPSLTLGQLGEVDTAVVNNW